MDKVKNDNQDLVSIESLGFVRTPTEEVEKNRCQAKEYLFKGPIMNPQDKELLKEQYREMRIRNRSYPPRKLITKEPKNKKFKSIIYLKHQTE
jgi:hypothetical protein